MTLAATKLEVAGAHLGAKARDFFLKRGPDIDSHVSHAFSDAPLPSENRMSITSLGAMANGTPATNKAQTWGGNNWQSGANGNMPASIPLAKPALGRDPKSRARSRDYLKQYVKIFRLSLPMYSKAFIFYW